MALIKANHKDYAHFIFATYLNHILKKSFHSFHIIGDIPPSSPEIPMLVLPNHATWWDGFFIYALNRLFWKKKYHVMMLEEQLKNYPFFTKLGAFSVRQNNTKDIITSLEYASQLIQSPNNLVNIFPQGILTPHYNRPLNLARGTDYLIRDIKNEIDIVLVGMRIEFLKERKPSVFFAFDNIEKKLYHTAKAEEHLTLLLETIDKSIIEENYGQEIILKK
jgi:1-acyl-sn-glycerol-3-phosphate acyltransferase